MDGKSSAETVDASDTAMAAHKHIYFVRHGERLDEAPGMTEVMHIIYDDINQGFANVSSLNDHLNSQFIRRQQLAT